MPDAKPASRALEIILLTLVAGSADAIGYLSLGKVFTSNMTGNVVLMGIAVSEGRGSDTGRSLFALLAFIIGNCVGAWLSNRAVRKDSPASAVTTIIGFEALLLLAFAVVSALLQPEQRPDSTYPLIGLLGMSMGLQAAAVFRLSTPGVTTTAITGTLTTMLNGVVRTFCFLPAASSENRGSASPFGLQAFVILTYFGGAAISGLLHVYAPLWAGFFPAAAVVAVVAARLARRS